MNIFNYDPDNETFLYKIENCIFNIFYVLSHPIYYIKRIIKGKKNYVRQLIHLSPNIKGSHEHICFAIRLLGKNYKYFCPHYNKKNFMPELFDVNYDCIDCKYYGEIGVNENKELYLGAEKNFVKLYNLERFENND